MVKRRLELEVLQATTLEGLPAPISMLPIELEAGRKMFVFTISGEERGRMTAEQLKNIAQTIGNLAHPHQATLIVIPTGSKLTAYEVRR